MLAKDITEKLQLIEQLMSLMNKYQVNNLIMEDISLNKTSFSEVSQNKVENTSLEAEEEELLFYSAK